MEFVFFSIRSLTLALPMRLDVFRRVINGLVHMK
jgi:hypothetical protein